MTELEEGILLVLVIEKVSLNCDAVSLGREEGRLEHIQSRARQVHEGMVGRHVTL